MALVCLVDGAMVSSFWLDGATCLAMLACSTRLVKAARVIVDLSGAVDAPDERLVWREFVQAVKEAEAGPSSGSASDEATSAERVERFLDLWCDAMNGGDRRHVHNHLDWIVETVRRETLEACWIAACEAKANFLYRACRLREESQVDPDAAEDQAVHYETMATGAEIAAARVKARADQFTRPASGDTSKEKP